MKNATAVLFAGLVGLGLAQQGLAGAGCGAKEKGACGSVKTEVKADAKDHVASYGTVDTSGLKKLVDVKTPLVLVDARSGKWDDGKRIPGAIAVAPDASAETIAEALPDKDQLIVTYCSNLKCPASKVLSESLIKLGYKNVLKYPEGIQGWIEAGQPVTGP